MVRARLCRLCKIFILELGLLPQITFACQIRVSSHTRQFGSFEEQINDMTGCFILKTAKDILMITNIVNLFEYRGTQMSFLRSV